MSALQPSLALLCKLGSIVVHTDEMMSPFGHQFDKIALERLLDDPEVLNWLAEMRDLAMVPVKRNR